MGLRRFVDLFLQSGNIIVVMGCVLALFYGFAGDNHQCPGLCSGNVTQDKEVTEENQRLLPAADGDTGTAVSGIYTEVFGGYYCHSDFSSNIDGAAEAMVHTIAAHPPSTITATSHMFRAGHERKLQFLCNLPFNTP